MSRDNILSITFTFKEIRRRLAKMICALPKKAQSQSPRGKKRAGSSVIFLSFFPSPRRGCSPQLLQITLSIRLHASNLIYYFRVGKLLSVQLASFLMVPVVVGSASDALTIKPFLSDNTELTRRKSSVTVFGLFWPRTKLPLN